MSERSEKRSSRVAMVVTIASHAIVAAMLIFLAAWKAPDPPIPDYGIELNLGFDATGSGDEQPVDQQQDATAQPEAVQPDQVEETPEPDPIPVETESPVVVKKEPEKKPEPKPEPKPQPKKEEPKKTEPEKPKVDNNAVFDPNATGNKPKQSQGDDTGKSGDKGSPEGKIDAKALYGDPGGGAGGTGAGLDLAGWKWESPPNVKMPEHEKNGKIVFEIVVDQDGEVIAIKPLERGLSPAAEKACRDAIMKLKLLPIGKNVPEESRGKITFSVKAQ